MSLASGRCLAKLVCRSSAKSENYWKWLLIEWTLFWDEWRPARGPFGGGGLYLVSCSIDSGGVIFKGVCVHLYIFWFPLMWSSKIQMLDTQNTRVRPREAGLRTPGPNLMEEIKRSILEKILPGHVSVLKSRAGSRHKCNSFCWLVSYVPFSTNDHSE